MIPWDVAECLMSVSPPFLLSALSPTLYEHCFGVKNQSMIVWSSLGTYCLRPQPVRVLSENFVKLCPTITHSCCCRLALFIFILFFLFCCFPMSHHTNNDSRSLYFISAKKNYLFVYLFGSAQGLLLDLCSGIASGRLGCQG